MRFPNFDHGDFLERAWRDQTPRFNIGSSGYVGGSWQDRGLPTLPSDFSPGDVNLRAKDDLQQALARHNDVGEDQVVATAGTTGANLAVMLWTHRAGGNVVVESPVYSPLWATAEGLGSEVRTVPREPDTAWRLDPDAVADVMDDRTDLIVLASPNNPTQAAASADDLRALGRLAEEHDAWVLVDQVYRELTDDPLAAPLHDRIISTAGFNKCWGLLGMRIGWLVAAPEAAAALQNVHMQVHMAPNPYFEAVTPGVLAMRDACRAHLETRLRATHAVYREWLASRPDVVDPAPRNLTAFPRLPVDDTATFCGRIAQDPGIVMVPGEYFGRAGHARIGLGGDPEVLRDGLAALGAELDALA